MNKKLITIVCAVHNEEEAIPLFYKRLCSVINSLDYSFEIIFTNNRSCDNSLEIIRGIRNADSRVKVLTLSRNFGYQCSLQAGMSYASGEAIITIDVDCEDPPELIPQFLAKWSSGFDVVYGIRKNRPEPRVILFFRNLFYKVLKITADANIILNMAEFGLIARHVRNAILNNSNTFPFLRAEIGYVGFRVCGIEYDRQKRIAGATHYNLIGMLIFAIGGILTSSTFPFRLAAITYPLIFLLNIFMMIASVVYSDFYFKLLVIIDFMYGLFLLTLHGIYLARIYKNGLNRPLYVIDWLLSTSELKENHHKNGA